jgi:hypothetical protein
VSRYLPASHTDHLIHSCETRLKHFLFSPDVSVADVSYEPPTHGGEHDPQQNSYLHDKPYEPDEDSWLRPNHPNTSEPHDPLHQPPADDTHNKHWTFVVHGFGWCSSLGVVELMMKTNS